MSQDRSRSKKSAKSDDSGSNEDHQAENSSLSSDSGHSSSYSFGLGQSQAKSERAKVQKNPPTDRPNSTQLKNSSKQFTEDDGLIQKQTHLSPTAKSLKNIRF